MMTEGFAQYMDEVASRLLGKPNAKLSANGKPRFGTNGAMSVDLENGRWFDHEKKEGGNVLELIGHMKGLARDDAVEWMRREGILEAKRNGATAHHAVAADKEPEAKRIFEAEYDYRDEAGKLLYQAIRCVFQTADGQFLKTPAGKRKKTFLQRRPDPDKNGSWLWSVKGVRLVPYRLSDLIEAIAEDKTVFIVEGERKVEALRAIGIPATCNVGGSGKWTSDLNPFLSGARVVIMPDNDEAGQKHAYQVGENLDTVAASVMLLDLPDLPPKGDVVDWIAEGGTAEDLGELVGRATEWKPTPAASFQSKFGLVMWSDQDASGGDEYEYLIEDLVPQAEPVLIIGESQSGKSFLTTHMALCGARGVPFFGRRILKPFGVIYCAYEAGKGFRDRLRAYRRHHGLNLDDLPFGVLTKPVNLWSDALSTNAIIAEILQAADQRFRGIPLGAVVIDTHNAATPGMNEIDSKDISVIRDRYKAIMSATGAGCWIIGHKNAAGKHRGNEQLYNNIETAIDISKKMTAERFPQLLRDADGRVLRHIKVIKQREGLDGEGWDFVLDQVDVGRNDKYGKPKTSCVPALPTAEERSGEPGSAKLTMQQRRFMEALFEGLDTFGGTPDSALGLPRSVVKVVDYSHVKKIFARRELNDGEDPRDHAGKLRTALSRARKELSARHIIGADNPFIWWSGRPIDGLSRTVTEARNAPVTAPETRTSERTEGGPETDIDELFGRS